ncbi:MAG: SAM-dependent methyltransferase, partial [Halobacteriaceae archaeon]
GGRMPDDVQDYINQQDSYKYDEGKALPEYYINMFEVCDRLAKENGRIGMLVPWSFMFNQSFQDFREDFIGGRGSFDFFSEFGYDILDNATVGTVGTVVRSQSADNQTGTFIRLADVEKSKKESKFLHAAFTDEMDEDVQRRYVRDLSEFVMVPGTTLSYWVPQELREL